MASDNRKNDIPADSPVMRSAMLNVTADGKNSFRTSVFGFNKEAVMSYIDRLYSEYAAEERRLNESLERLQRVNAVLQERSDTLDAQINEMRDKVVSEIAYVQDFHEIEDSYKEKIEGLSKEVDALAEKYSNEVSEKNDLHEKLKEALAESENARTEFTVSRDELQDTVAEKEEEIRKLLASAELRIVWLPARYPTRFSVFPAKSFSKSASILHPHSKVHFSTLSISARGRFFITTSLPSLNATSEKA